MSNLDKLFTAIAQQHLHIGTLRTRKRDSLDFHDCSVWGIKDALQAAYNAGKEGRTLPEPRPDDPTTDDRRFSFLGVVHASYREMVATFGKPQKGDGYKVEVIWKVKLAPFVEVEI